MANAAIICGLIGAADGIEANIMINILNPKDDKESKIPKRQKSVKDRINNSLFQEMIPKSPT
jgi:hypothetical protein